MKREPIWTKTFLSLFCTNLSVFIIFYGLISTLPLYAKDILNRSDEEAGSLMSIFLLSAIIVRPFTGKVLDIVGKRKLLWISIVLYLICTVAYYFIEPFEGLMVLRFIHGIFFSIVSTAAGSLAVDNVPMTRRGAGLGYFAMSTNLAVVLGPLIGLFLIQKYSFDVLFIVISVLMAFGVGISLMIPERKSPNTNQVVKKMVLGDLFERKALPVSTMALVVAFAYASVLAYLSIYSQEKGLLGLTSTFFLVFAAIMLLTRPFTGRIFDEKGPQYILIPGFISFIIGYVLLSNVDSATLFLISGAFLGFGYGCIVPSLQALAMQSTQHERSGYATATFFTFFDGGIAIGSFVFGLIAVRTGYPLIYLISAAIIAALCIVYVMKGWKKRSPSTL